jgi:hypothetical protein
MTHINVKGNRYHGNHSIPVRPSWHPGLFWHRHGSETDQHALRCSVAQILLLKNEKERSPKREVKATGVGHPFAKGANRLEDTH